MRHIQSIYTSSMIRVKGWKRRTKILVGSLLILLTGWLVCLPSALFQDPFSAVLLDREEGLLGARIALDGQWRFAAEGHVPEKFATAIIAFEDKRFRSHPGIDPAAVARAIWLNLSKGEVRSGGSTLTMQVIRLSRKGRSRTVFEKLIEMFQATRLELRLSKEEILRMYASHAPFGGNVVGLEAASWRYFGRSAADLSWAEVATLAVLPNAPALIHPGRNRDALTRKRNFLLDKLLEQGTIDSLDWELALAEPIPASPKPIPDLAPHLLERARMEQGAMLLHSTIDRHLQARANDLVGIHYRRLRQNGIHNAAMVVANTRTGEVVAYVGNTDDPGMSHQNRVDIVMASRSTGSILKPFLYASMLEEGEILPDLLVADVPSYYGSFSPANYDRSYRGAVFASEALARSLNIPAVRMLYKHGVHRFYERLKQMGMTSLFRSSEEYGLSLILGGAEGKLWDMTGMYTSMASILERYRSYNGRYEPSPFQPLVYEMGQAREEWSPDRFDELKPHSPIGAGAIWYTFEAMQEVSRPGEEASWRNFGSSRRVAWKTGTSYGFRDAWSIGVVPGYVVGVWVGNADGEGRPGLIGSEAAAPLMFDMMSSLHQEGGWFSIPYDDLDPVSVCPQSGHIAGMFCPVRDTMLIPRKGVETEPCRYHRQIWLSSDRRHRVNSDCENLIGVAPDSMFVLSPLQGQYYSREHPAYRPVPPFRDDCRGGEEDQYSPISLGYPLENARLFVPLQLDGSRGGVGLEVFHQNSDAVVFWHLDDEFLGETSGIHQQTIFPNPGVHTLTLVDNHGNELRRSFQIIAGEEGS